MSFPMVVCAHCKQRLFHLESGTLGNSNLPWVQEGDSPSLFRQGIALHGNGKSRGPALICWASSLFRVYVCPVGLESAYSDWFPLNELPVDRADTARRK